MYKLYWSDTKLLSCSPDKFCYLLLIFALVFTVVSQLLGTIFIFVTTSHKTQLPSESAKWRICLPNEIINCSVIMPWASLVWSFYIPWRAYPTSQRECKYLLSWNIRTILMSKDLSCIFSIWNKLWNVEIFQS